MGLFWKANSQGAAKQSINVGTDLFDNNKQGGTPSTTALYENIDGQILALQNALTIPNVDKSSVKKINKSIKDLSIMNNAMECGTVSNYHGAELAIGTKPTSATSNIDEVIVKWVDNGTEYTGQTGLFDYLFDDEE